METKTYTIYTTYFFQTNKEGFSDSIHCNYINEVEITTDNISKHKIWMDFSEGSFNQPIDYVTMYGLIQYQVHDGDNKVRPVYNEWKKVDFSSDFISGTTNLSVNRFEFDLNKYSTWSPYFLTEDINYPTKSQTKNENLSFGEERILLGNVGSEIKADVYTTEILIDLPSTDFNTTTNKTWDGESSIYITEIGIYDENKNLVGIGKLNNPIEKNDNISRSLLFSLDF